MFALLISLCLSAEKWPTDTEPWNEPSIISKWPTDTEDWGVPPTEFPEDESGHGLLEMLLIACGGLVVLIVIIVVAVTICRRRKLRLDKKNDGYIGHPLLTTDSISNR